MKSHCCCLLLGALAFAMRLNFDDDNGTFFCFLCLSRIGSVWQLRFQC